MARVRTFVALQAEALALADCGNDPHITQADDGEGGFINLAELWVNQGIAELWRKLVHVSPDRYVISDDLTTTVGTSAYALEDDFLAIRRVDRISGTQRIAIERFEFQEVPYYSSDSRSGAMPRYREIGQGVDGSNTQIHFDPDPGAHTYRIWYVAAPPILTADDDEFDGVAGYEDWAVCYAALRMCQRDETDPTAIMAEMARIDASIIASASHRDMGRAPRIANVRARGFPR